MRAPSKPFAGVPRQTTTFLTGLANNNRKEWFEDHRDDYETYWIDVGLQLIVALGDRLRALEPNIVAEPKINGSLFRIHRDTRFSKDKTPYKDHLDLWFWDDTQKKTAATGFWLRIQGKTWGIGVGNHGFAKEDLGLYRDAVADPKSGPALLKIIAAIEATGAPVNGEKYKRVPSAYSVDDEGLQRLLRFGNLAAGDAVMPHPKTLRSAAFVDTALHHWQALLPLHRWLKTNVQQKR